MMRHGWCFLLSVLQVLSEDGESWFAYPLWSELLLQRPQASEVWIHIRDDHICAFSNKLMPFSHCVPSSASDQDAGSLLGKYHWTGQQLFSSSWLAFHVTCPQPFTQLNGRNLHEDVECMVVVRGRSMLRLSEWWWQEGRDMLMGGQWGHLPLKAY